MVCEAGMVDCVCPLACVGVSVCGHQKVGVYDCARAGVCAGVHGRACVRACVYVCLLVCLCVSGGKGAVHLGREIDFLNVLSLERIRLV